MTMGEYIKQLRESKGLTQKELGQLVGVNTAAVNKWEKGRVVNIKRETVEKLAKVFDILPSQLMCFDGEGPSRFSGTNRKEYAILVDRLSWSNHQIMNVGEQYLVYVGGKWLPLTERDMKLLEDTAMEQDRFLGEMAANLAEMRRDDSDE